MYCHALYWMVRPRFNDIGLDVVGYWKEFKLIAKSFLVPLPERKHRAGRRNSFSSRVRHGGLVCENIQLCELVYAFSEAHTMRLMNPHRAEGVMLRFSRLGVLWRDRCAADRARPLPETCEWRRVPPLERRARGGNIFLAFTPIVDCRIVTWDQASSQVGSVLTGSDPGRSRVVEQGFLLNNGAEDLSADLCNAKRLIASDSSQCSVAVLEIRSKSLATKSQRHEVSQNQIVFLCVFEP